MRTHRMLFTAGALLLIAAAEHTFAQPGTVLWHQTISSTEGGFTGDLDDGDGFGGPVAWLGDLDGDGVGDLAVGASGDDDGGDSHGAVWVLFLNANGTVKGHQKISDTEGGFDGELSGGDNFATALAAFGDLDGDGVTELAVGANNDGAYGAVWVLFLNRNGTVKSHKKIIGTGGYFGYSVAPLGDLDGDGVRDMAVGAYFGGGVWVLFLNADGTVKSDHNISDYTGYFGSSVASLGDFDGDGVTDLAVGAPGDSDGGESNTGAAWVLFLNSDGTVKGHQKISDTEGGFDGELDRDDFFGISMTALDDLDGDGVNDLAVGAFRDDDGGRWTGAVWILFLNTDGTVKGHQKISATEGGFDGDLDDHAHFGGSLASLGDLDGDGRTDLAVSGGVPEPEGGLWMLFLDGVPLGPELTTLGECPGPMRFKVEGAISGGRVAYLYARDEGFVIIPPGNPCAGTQLGLNATVQLAGVERADESGIARLDIERVPGRACGRIYIQALDLETCATTNVVLIQ